MAVLLGLQGIVFAAWTYWMFRCLFRLRRRAVAETGSAFPGLGATLRSFAAFATLPDHARDRRILLALTVAVTTGDVLAACIADPISIRILDLVLIHLLLLSGNLLCGTRPVGRTPLILSDPGYRHRPEYQTCCER